MIKLLGYGDLPTLILETVFKTWTISELILVENDILISFLSSYLGFSIIRIKFQAENPHFIN